MRKMGMNCLYCHKLIKNTYPGRKYCSFKCAGKVSGPIGGKACTDKQRTMKTGWFDKDIWKKAHKNSMITNRKNGTGCFDSEVGRKGGKIGGKNMHKIHPGMACENGKKGVKTQMRLKLGIFGLTKKARSMHSKEVRKNLIFPLKDSKIEVKIQNFLKELGITFFTHQYMHIEHGYQCDILVPAMNLVIECDGDYWHSYPTGTEIDHIRTRELIENGFKVLRLWEFEINKMTLEEFKDKLK
jgi:very-short-patch-repair endonuclease